MNDEVRGAAIVLIGLFLLVIAGWITQSHFEMKAFNKFSDKKTTLTDAMFAELRIMPDK